MGGGGWVTMMRCLYGGKLGANFLGRKELSRLSWTFNGGSSSRRDSFRPFLSKHGTFHEFGDMNIDSKQGALYRGSRTTQIGAFITYLPHLQTLDPKLYPFFQAQEPPSPRAFLSLELYLLSFCRHPRVVVKTVAVLF